MICSCPRCGLIFEQQIDSPLFASIFRYLAADQEAQALIREMADIIKNPTTPQEEKAAAVAKLKETLFPMKDLAKDDEEKESHYHE